MTERQRTPEELVNDNRLNTIEPGMVLQSTRTNKLLFITEVTNGKVKGKPVNEQGQLTNEPDRWISVDERIAKKLMIEVKGIDVSHLQGYIEAEVRSIMN